MNWKKVLLAFLVVSTLGAIYPQVTDDSLIWKHLQADFRLDHQVNTSASVRVQRDWYVANSTHLEIILERSSPFLYLIVEELERRNMPGELALLPVIESSYDPNAYSHSHAAGLWQMIPSTGRNYGLEQNNWYDGRRDISVGAINRRADSEYQGQQSGIYLDGGYKFDVGHNIVVTPLTSLQWTHLSLGSYTETDAGALDLMVNRQSYNILESGLGASISSKETYSWGNLTPEFHAKWLYDFINDDMSVTSAFTGGGASFVSTGANPARNAANIGGSLSFDFKHDISLIAGVDTEIKDNFFGVYGSVSLRYKF